MWISLFISRGSAFAPVERRQETNGKMLTQVWSSTICFLYFFFSLRRRVSPYMFYVFAFCSLRFSFIISSGFLLAVQLALIQFLRCQERETLRNSFPSLKLLSPLSRLMAIVVMRNRFYQLPVQGKAGVRESGLSFRTSIPREWNQSYYGLSIWQHRAKPDFWCLIFLFVFMFDWSEPESNKTTAEWLSRSFPGTMFNEFIRKSSFTILPNSYRIKFPFFLFSSESFENDGVTSLYRSRLSSRCIYKSSDRQTEKL